MNARIFVPVILVIIIVVAGWLLFTGFPAPENQPVSLAIMTTSDLQSQVEPYPNETGLYVGGFSRISGVHK